MAILLYKAVKLMSSIQSKFECFQGSTNRLVRRLIGPNWSELFKILLVLEQFALVRGSLTVSLRSRYMDEKKIIPCKISEEQLGLYLD